MAKSHGSGVSDLCQVKGAPFPSRAVYPPPQKELIGSRPPLGGVLAPAAQFSVPLTTVLGFLLASCLGYLENT